MRTIFLLFLSVALAAAGGLAATNGLTVLTYNIHIGRGLDGGYSLDRIAGIIRAADADLVALQEVDRGTRRSRGDDQPAELARRLPGYQAYFAPAMKHDGGEYGECVLSRLPVRTNRTIQLPGPAGFEPRAAALIEVEWRGRPLTFVGTHIDHRSADVRAAQLRTLEAALPADADTPAVLAGDFNAHPAQPEMQLLTNRWRVTWPGPAPATYPANQPDIAIDHVFVWPAGLAEGAECVVVDEPVASDHRPVRVRLTGGAVSARPSRSP